MSRFASLAGIAAVAVLAQGCKTSRPYNRTNDPGGKPLSPSSTGSVILTGRALSSDPGRTVLDAIRYAMPQLRVTGWTQYTRCPLLELRGKDSMQGNNDPDVYVDGTRTSDTCPLVTIQAVQTERIEVYPLGVTSRPGYQSSGHGLILIFLSRADSDSI
ncbi:MAG: hypothetical protein DMD62_13705 [Gemmatimonadetes bacterium]|nr:MAG: hypothetical protein DMD62_13705 [Gemmatimonadota bacterium]